MPMKKPDNITIFAGHATSSPTDSTIYYIGGKYGNGIGTGAGNFRIYLPATGFIRRCYVYAGSDTNTTNEDIEYDIRLNNTTDYLIGTANFAGGKMLALNNTNLNVPVNMGDYIEIKMVTPAWVTNPTNYYTHITILIEVW